MSLVSTVSGLFKWRQFEPEVILLAIGWYLRFSLSYRDVEELLAERGVHADHVTIWRWVQRYAPEVAKRLRKRLKATNDSWRVDETYVQVKGQWRYLYRAVDSSGATLDFLLSAKQDAEAARRFLAKALGRPNHPEPRVIHTDGHGAYPRDRAKPEATQGGDSGPVCLRRISARRRTSARTGRHARPFLERRRVRRTDKVLQKPFVRSGRPALGCLRFGPVSW
jgi:transposase-like protein